MATLREIRRRIASVRSTQQITKAMKMVAAAKLRRAQENILATRPYAGKMQGVLRKLVSKTEMYQHPLLLQRGGSDILIIVVTADRGLCGAFNSNLIRYTEHVIAAAEGESMHLLTVGRKGAEYFARRNYEIYNKKVNFFNHLAFSDAREIVDQVVETYLAGKFDRIEVVYNEFKSALQQNIVREQILPFTPDEEAEAESSQVDYLYEPSREEILTALIPRYLNIQMWKVLLESNAAEQGARMTAMENATENAEELIDNLSLTYNRARQAAITKEISEIVGGAEALKEK
jgi:F-type H+-transporting ATPase subunit gamma